MAETGGGFMDEQSLLLRGGDTQLWDLAAELDEPQAQDQRDAVIFSRLVDGSRVRFCDRIRGNLQQNVHVMVATGSVIQGQLFAAYDGCLIVRERSADWIVPIHAIEAIRNLKGRRVEPARGAQRGAGVSALLDWIGRSVVVGTASGGGGSGELVEIGADFVAVGGEYPLLYPWASLSWIRSRY